MQIEPTSIIVGNVVSGNASNTLSLVGAAGTTGTFDVSQFGPDKQYQGFGIGSKDEDGTWKLTNSTGSTTTPANWKLTGGTLELDTDQLGATQFALSGGTLLYTNGLNVSNPLSVSAAAQVAVNGTDAATQAGPITGEGFTKSGTGTLILTGENTNTGTTTISEGTLQIGNGGATGSVAGPIANNGALIIDRTGDVSLPGVISGTGTLTNRGTGVTTLSGANTYTGATAVNTGTLLVNGALANTALSVAPGATLGGTGSVAGPATLAAGATLAPGAAAGQAGTLTLGATTLDPAATLTYDLAKVNTIGVENDLLKVNGDLNLAGTLNVNDGGDLANEPGSYRLIDYTGTLSGAGLKLGTIAPIFAGSVIQTAVPGQVNLIAVYQGVPVQFWNASGLRALGANGGTGTWDNAQPNWSNVDATISQAYLPGLAIFAGTAGTVTLGDAVTTGAMQFSTDGYRIEGNGHVLTLAGLPNNLKPLVRVGPDQTATIAAELAGTAGMRKGDAGTLVLTGANTYTGGTEIAGGTLQLGDGGTTGSIAGDIANDANLVFNRTDDVTFANIVSGTGSVSQNGTGNVTLTGTSPYTGATTINAGRLTVNGSLAGTTVNVMNGAALAGTGTVGAFVANAGSTIAPGDASVPLRATRPAQSVAPAARAVAAVAPAAVAPVTSRAAGPTLGIAPAARAVGLATMNATAKATDLNVAPATLTVARDATFNAGSTYRVHVTPDGQSTLLQVGGVATLNGGTVQVLPAPGVFSAANRFVILSADGGVKGTFAALDAPGLDTGFAFVTPALSYDANTVFLFAQRNTVPFASLGVTPNERATAAALDALGTNNALNQAITNLDASQARAAFNAASGELHASVKSVILDESNFFSDTVLNRARQAFAADSDALAALQAQSIAVQVADASGSFWPTKMAADESADGSADALPGMGAGSANHAKVQTGSPDGAFQMSAAHDAASASGPGGAGTTPSAPAHGPAVWAQGLGTWGHLSSDGNAASVSHSTAGFFAGADGPVGNHWRLGAAGGVTRSNLNIDDRASAASIDNYQFGIYSGAQYGPIGLTVGVAQAWHSIEANRAIAFAGFSDRAHAKYSATTTQFFGEASYTAQLRRVALQPFAGLSYTRLNTDGFSETGGDAALRAAGDHQQVTATTLGTRAAISFDMPHAAHLTLRGSAGWRHSFGNTTPGTELAFITGGASPFAIAGVPIAKDAAVIEAGAYAQLSPRATISIGYSGQIGKRAQDHAIKGGVTWTF